MKIARKDPGKKIQENLKKSSRNNFAIQREKFLESLKENEDFQVFFVQPLTEEINKLLDIRNVPNGNYEEMGKLVYQNKLVVSIIEKHISPVRK